MQEYQERWFYVTPLKLREGRRALLPTLALLVLVAPAWAQDRGGIRLAPSAARGPVGIAQPLPFTPPSITAADLQTGLSATDRKARHQDMIARLRGDAGYLAGFSFGQPLAPSRQKSLPGGDGYGYGYGADAPALVINNIDGPIAIATGNGNVIQQQTAHSPGPVAQQQVATIAGRTQQTNAGPANLSSGLSVSAGGGAVNIVSGNGNIVQRAPGSR